MVDTSRSMLALVPCSRIASLLHTLAAASLLLLPLASPAAGHVDPRAADFASHGFTEAIAVCRLPDTCAGKRPLVSRKEPVRETGNDNIVEEHLVRFHGLEISFLFVFGNAAEPSPTDWKKGDPYPPPFITSLKITAGDWPVRHGLRIGTSRAAVERVLGRIAVDDSGCAGILDETTMDQVTLCFVKDRLRSLEWTPWWDG